MKLCFLLFSLFLFFLIGCNERKNTSFDVEKDIIYVLYTDSTFTKAIDSLYINNNDTVYFNAKFPLNGYFKRYRFNRLEIEQGRYSQNKEVGLWHFYTTESDDNLRLYKEESYNMIGELDGKFAYYNNGDSNPVLYYNYKNGIQTGIQKEVYPSGELLCRYEKDDTGNYINDYIVLAKNGDTIYFENFGITGTGIAKHYNILNNLEWVQSYINKKIDGWSVEYITSSDNDLQPRFRSLFKEDQLLYSVEIYDKDNWNDDLKVNIDSIIYTYQDNKTFIKYYSGNNIVKEDHN